ncbi:MAG: ABC transporter permease [Alphaproteobacteria bacterium]|nr:ABC transporter permease [Alphaproteobacteria bacterium]
MSAFILRRLLQSAAVVVAMTLIVFFGVSVIGDPIDMFAPQQCDQRCVAELRRQFGLDRPLWEQYVVFIRNALRGEIGNSFQFGLPALDVILDRAPATLELALAAVLLAFVIGVPLGMWAGLRPDALSSRMIMTVSTVGFSVPTFWLGLIFIMVFALWLGWLPTTGRGATMRVLGIEWSFLTPSGLAHLILPAATLAVFNIALVIRLTRAGMREVLFADYVKYARAKGVAERRILLTHVLKNILIPVVTVLGMEFGGTVAFAVVTETIFSWPGMGKLLIDAIEVLDRPLIVAYLVLVAVLFVAINLLVDILYSVLDPRVRLGGRRR